MPPRTFKDRYQQPTRSRSQSVIGEKTADNASAGEVPVASKGSPRKKRKYSASPQPEMSTRLRLNPKKTPKSQGHSPRSQVKSPRKQRTPTKQGNYRQRLLGRSTANLGDLSGSPGASEYHHTSDALLESPQPSSGNAGYGAGSADGRRSLTVSEVAPIGRPQDFLNPNRNAIVYHPSYGYGWVTQPKFATPAPGLQRPVRAPSQELCTHSSDWTLEEKSPARSMSHPPPNERPQSGLPLASPFSTATKRLATAPPMSPVLENDLVHPCEDSDAIVSKQDSTHARLPPFGKSLPDTSEEQRTAIPRTQGDCSNTSPLRTSGEETDSASGLEALNNHLLELSESTGLTALEIWAKWHIIFGEGEANSRSQQFKHFAASMQAIAQSGSSDLEFETVICIIGRDIRRDQELSTTICSPMVPNFFSSRLCVADIEIESQLKAHAYDYVSRRAPPKLLLVPTSHENLQQHVMEDAASGSSTLPSNAVRVEMDHTSVSETPPNYPGRSATSELQDVKPGISGGTKKKEGDQRISELKMKLRELTKPCGIERLTKSPLQYALMPKLLAAHGWVLENWPEDVPFPCDVKTGKGIAGLSANHREMLLKALEDQIFPLKAVRKSSEAIPAGVPVIYGVPPPPESNFMRGRRRFLDDNDTEDREGAPRRLSEALAKEMDKGQGARDPPGIDHSQERSVPGEIPNISQSTADRVAQLRDEKNDAALSTGPSYVDGRETGDSELKYRTSEVNQSKPGTVPSDRDHAAKPSTGQGGHSREGTHGLQQQPRGNIPQADHRQNAGGDHYDANLAGPRNAQWHPGTYPVQRASQYHATNSQFMPFIPAGLPAAPHRQDGMFTAPGQFLPVQFSNLSQPQQFPFVPIQNARAYSNDQHGHGHPGTGYYVLDRRPPPEHMGQNSKAFCGQDRLASDR